MLRSGGNLFFSMYLMSDILSHTDWQEPFTDDALSQGAVLQTLFPNSLICVKESEVASLSSRNSTGFERKGKSQYFKALGWREL